MSIEARAVRRGLRSLGKSEIAVHVIGIGATRLPRAADIPPGSVIILAGFAGGLNPKLNVGDLVVDGVESEKVGRREGVKVWEGKIFGGHFVSSVAEKGALFAETEAVAVDMESAAVRRFAEGSGAEFIGLRAITDRADQAVDAGLLDLVDEVGRPLLGRILRRMMQEPSFLFGLVSLERAGRAAARSLELGIVGLVGKERGETRAEPGANGGESRGAGRSRSIVYVTAGLALVSVALFFTLRHREKFGTDELVAGWFCLGTPLLLLGSALLVAALADPKRRRGQPGFCPRCGEWLGGMDLFCPQCGSSAVGWAVPPRMKTRRAARINWERPVSQRHRPRKVNVNVSTETRQAAEFLVEQSLSPAGENAELTTACLSDAATARRLYHVAARRLHPDSNHGAQLEDWDRLQKAMAVLKEFHRMD
jgi:adenosylhomocysteine nucleosidase